MFSLHVDTARTWRGGQNQVLLTVLGLRMRGHRAALVAHPHGELRRRAAEGPDLFPLAPRTEMAFRAGWQLSRLLRDLRPDIVHAHDAHGVAMTALACSMCGERIRPRFVASRRVDFHIGRNAFSRWKYRQVDRFVCASQFIQSMLIHDGIPAAKTSVVYEGIDLRRVERAPTIDLRKELWLPRGAPLVGNVAALVPHKGQRYLIDAAVRVIREVHDARFIIAGEGELEHDLARHVARCKLGKHIVFAGFRPDVLSLHKAFDLFVMSSVTEGLGTSALDAMAAGRAVVATRAGGLSEVVDDGHTGLLVPTRDPPALAAAIVRLLSDETFRQTCAHNALQQARRRFSAERMVDETLATYEHLVGTPPATDTGHPVGAD